MDDSLRRQSLLFHVVIFMVGERFRLAAEFEHAAVPVITLSNKAPRTTEPHRSFGIVQFDNKVAVFFINTVNAAEPAVSGSERPQQPGLS